MTNEVENLPELRFSGFSGKWEEKNFEELFDIHNNLRKPIKESHRVEGIYRYYGATGVIDFVNHYIFDGEYILIGEDGANIITRSAPLVYLAKGKFWVNNHAHILTPKNGNIYYLFLVAENVNYLKYNTGTAQPKLNIQNLKNINVNITIDINEQQKIGNFFSKLDHQIELEEQKLKKLEEQKKGYMQKIFSQELRFKDEKGNYYPEWESRYLNELCLINPKVDQVPNSFLYIDLESVNNGKIEKIKEVNKINAPSRAQRLAKKYDVFYQTVRPYQKNNFINLSNRNDIVVSTGYAQLRPSVQFYYLYSLLLTNSFMNKVLVKCTGTNYPAINSTDLSLIQILSSSVFEEQEKIGNFFSKLDELINKQNQKIDGLKKRKRGFLQKMFV